jgi:twitching motility protein PilT
MVSAALSQIRLHDLLRIARERDASDIHLAIGEAPGLRIEGTLGRLNTAPIEAAELDYFTTDLLGAGALRRLHDYGDADGIVRHPELGTYRVHAFRAEGSVRFAIRLLSATIPCLDELELPSALHAFTARRSGLALFVGPTGSGKSTALAALIDRINRTDSRHIITVEDPVEYRHSPLRSSVAHRELGADFSDYPAAIRSALRANPDVIAIGELRDHATIRAALGAAETGHFVLSTLHTNDATAAVDRIIDAFEAAARHEARAILAQVLVGITSLRLLPRERVGGRRAASEILIATEAVRSLIREGKAHQLRNAIVTGRSAGMQTLEAHLSDLVARGEISLENARASTDRPDEVRTLSGGSR